MKKIDIINEKGKEFLDDLVSILDKHDANITKLSLYASDGEILVRKSDEEEYWDSFILKQILEGSPPEMNDKN